MTDDLLTITQAWITAIREQRAAYNAYISALEEDFRPAMEAYKKASDARNAAEQRMNAAVRV